MLVVFFLPAFIFFSCKEKSAPSTVESLMNEQKKLLVENLDKQVKVHPDSAGLRMRLIDALDSLGMYKQALQHTDSLIKNDSLNNGLWFTKARLQESAMDTTSAIQSYSRAIAIYPSVDAQLNLANLYAERKDSKSLLICQSVARMGLGREIDASCDFIAGVYYARTANSQQAILLFDRCINNNYTYMEAYMEKGFVQFDNKKFDDALKTFQTAITVNNRYADAYYWTAKTYEATSKKEDALLNYQRALGLDKNLEAAKDAVKRLE